MSTRCFNKDEIEKLKANKYTYSVTPNTISFTIAFKIEFWNRYQRGELPRDIVTDLGYDPEMLGAVRISGLVGMIRKQAEENNFRQGQHGAVSAHSDYSQIPDDQKIAAMENELYYLRQEIEFLKKIHPVDPVRR